MGEIYNRRRFKWTKEDIIERILAWNAEYGHPPGANEWHPGQCRQAASTSANRAAAWMQRVTRWEEGEWPWTGSVLKRFGSWNNAIEAAGLDPREAIRPIETEAILSNDPATMKKLLKQVESSEGSRKLTLLYTISSTALAMANELENSDG